MGKNEKRLLRVWEISRYSSRILDELEDLRFFESSIASTGCHEEDLLFILLLLDVRVNGFDCLVECFENITTFDGI